MLCLQISLGCPAKQFASSSAGRPPFWVYSVYSWSHNFLRCPLPLHGIRSAFAVGWIQHRCQDFGFSTRASMSFNSACASTKAMKPLRSHYERPVAAGGESVRLHEEGTEKRVTLRLIELLCWRFAEPFQHGLLTGVGLKRSLSYRVDASTQRTLSNSKDFQRLQSSRAFIPRVTMDRITSN